jgi:hypothetical protein
LINTARQNAAAAATLLILLALALTITSCAKERPMLTQADLDARPPLTEMQDRYDEMQQRIRDAIDGVLGRGDWELLIDHVGYGNCDGRGFVNGVDGHQITMPLWLLKTTITDAEWPAVRQAIIAVVEPYGFRAGGMAQNTGGNHELFAFDSYGANVNVGNSLYTGLQVTSGCHPGKPRELR